MNPNKHEHRIKQSQVADRERVKSEINKDDYDIFITINKMFGDKYSHYGVYNLYTKESVYDGYEHQSVCISYQNNLYDIHYNNGYEYIYIAKDILPADIFKEWYKFVGENKKDK